MRRRSGMYLDGRSQTAAENDVKVISQRLTGHRGVPVKKRDQAIARVLVGNAVENGIERQQRISRKIHLRDQAREQPGTEEREVNVRRAPGVRMILPRVRARLYRNKTITAFPIGQHTSAAREIRVQRGIVLIHAMAVAPSRIGLPNLNESSGNRVAFFI